MSILQIELPDEQLQQLSEEARVAGYEESGAYLLAIWRSVSELYPHGDAPTPEQLERQKQLLLESLEGEGEVADEAWWAKLQAEVEAKVAAKVGAGQAA